MPILVHPRRPAAALAVVLALIVPACVGPSRTKDDYERKAANAAEAMVSVVESALMTVDVAADGRAPAPYVSLRLSESEDDAASIEAAFAAVQPPDPDLDERRTEVLTVIGNAGDVVEELRLASYRGELERLREIAGELEGPLQHLRRLTEIAPT